MNEYSNFSNNNQSNEYIISSDKHNSNILTAFSLRNTSTAYNSYLSNEFQLSKNNGIKQNIGFSDIFKPKNNEIRFNIKKNNNNYRKKDYSKLLNVPQSNRSTFCDSKNKFYSNSHFNIKNLNSKLKENKTYNKIKINELIEMTQNRKKLIEEKIKEEQLKKLKITLEEEKLLKLMGDTDNKLCEEGVQTSLVINKNNNETNNKLNKEENNNIIKIDKNTIKNDLINIGNDTRRNINNNSSFNIICNDDNKNNNNNNSELSFDIEVNQDNIEHEQKDLSNDSFESQKKEADSNSSSNKDNNTSKVEEYDINKEYLKNETKSSIQDYIDKVEKQDNNKKINLKLNKSRSALFTRINRYENIDINNLESLDNKVEDKQNINKNIISNKINIKDSKKNKNIEKIKFINSNENIKKQLKRNKNQNNNLNKQILNKMGIINNKSDSYKIKQKRIKDNYSYYFKLKEKAKK